MATITSSWRQESERLTARQRVFILYRDYKSRTRTRGIDQLHRRARNRSFALGKRET